MISLSANYQSFSCNINGFFFFFALLLSKKMATPLIAETIRSTRGKYKLVIIGFIHTLNKSSTELEYWVLEKRGQCKHELQPGMV